MIHRIRRADNGRGSFKFPASWLGTASLVLLASAATASGLPDREFVEHVEARVESGEYVGMIVGLVDGGQTYVQAFGTVSKNSDRPPDGRTIFEISSITKTFVATVLARSVIDQRLDLGHPANRYLEPDASLKAYDGREITLLDLAAHQSGLPYLPANLSPGEAPNPYAQTTTDDLMAAIDAFSPTEAPGQGYSYSAFAYGVLALILERVRGADVFALIRRDITGPLEMPDTVQMLDSDQARRKATGYTPAGDEAVGLDQGIFNAAGSMHSTLDDLMNWLRANLQPDRSPLGNALVLAHEIQNDEGTTGLAWHRTEGYDDRSQYGTANGFRAYVGFLADGSRGAIILANTRVDAAALGSRLLLGTNLPD